MGGDHGPHVTVPAALDFQSRWPDVDLVLVGIGDAIEAELRRRGAGAGPRLRVQAASEVVGMDEPPAQATENSSSVSVRTAWGWPMWRSLAMARRYCRKKART